MEGSIGNVLFGGSSTGGITGCASKRNEKEKVKIEKSVGNILFGGSSTGGITGCASKRAEDSDAKKLKEVCANLAPADKLLCNIDYHKTQIDKVGKHFTPWLFGWRPPGLVRQDNGALLKLAKEYLALYQLTADPDFIDRAIESLERAISNRDTFSNPDNIEMYFELVLQKGEALLQLDPSLALPYVEKIISDLANEGFYRQLGESDISVIGYRLRAQLIKADALNSLEQFDQADIIFTQTAQQCQELLSSPQVVLFLENQKDYQIKYLLHQAKYKTALIELRKGNLEKAWDKLAELLTDKPAFDIIFSALAAGLAISVRRQSGLEPNIWFNKTIPWETLNQDEEFKKELGITIDLTDPQIDKFYLFLDLFLQPNISLDKTVREVLKRIKVWQLLQ